MRKMKLLLIIGGVLLTGIVAIIQYLEDERNKKESKENEDALNAKIDTLQKSNLLLSEKLNSLSLENAKLSQQLTESSLRLNESTIGEGKLDFEITLYSDDEFRFRFINNNDLPIYDAFITITNNSELLKCEVVSKNDKEVFFKSTCRELTNYQEAPITINPHAAFISGKIYKLESNLNFSIKITSRKDTRMIQCTYIIKDGIYHLCKRELKITKNRTELINQVLGFDLPKDYWENHFFGTRKIMYLKKD